MTLFFNLRTKTVGGAINTNPQLYEGLGAESGPGWSLIPPARIQSVVAGKSLLFAAHGFNINQSNGLVSLGLLDKYLAFAAPSVLIGVLWPGDSVIPIVDYPFEGSVAIDCGAKLADFCNEYCGSAQTISFVSHSLGARVVLEAVSRLKRKARSVCLTAAAINRDCLTTEYVVAARNSEQISILASREDMVLKIAFSVADPFADLLHDDHSPFQVALGSVGPPPTAPPQVRAPWQISNDGAAGDYGHSDYLPPDSPQKWPRVAEFMRRAFLDQPQTWPSA
jgi:hypothetical protein